MDRLAGLDLRIFSTGKFPSQTIGEGMKKLIARFVRETEGQDLIEYALLAALIGLATTAAMTALSGSLSTEFSKIGSSVTSAS